MTTKQLAELVRYPIDHPDPLEQIIETEVAAYEAKHRRKER